MSAEVPISNRRILVVAPHIDDEVACGGLLHKVRRTSSISIVALSSCDESLPEGCRPEDIRSEFRLACKTIGAAGVVHGLRVRHFPEHRQDILELLVQTRKAISPDLVLCPSSADGHQDHQTVHAECKRAFPATTILGWEPLTIPNLLHVTLFVELTKENLEAKLSLYDLYTTQHWRTWQTRQLYKHLAAARGIQARTASGYAEAYETIRQHVR